MTNKKIQTQGALFAAVQLSGLFNDSKAFPDSISLHPPEGIEASFRALLEEFISENFQSPTDHPEVEIPKSASLDEHIDNLWNILQRSPDNRSSIPKITG